MQDIQNDFTIKAYESNAYFAMKHCDYLQFNECITQLLFLYKTGKSDNKNKFLMCRILQFGFNGMTAEMHRFLKESCVSFLSDPSAKTALLVIEAINTLNYAFILKSYSDCEDEYVRFMIGMFLPKIQVWVLRIISET